MKATEIKTYTIRRRRLGRSPLATGPGPAWTWLYDVLCEGVELCHGTSPLQSAKNYIARHAREHDRPRFAVRFEWQPVPSTFRPCRRVVGDEH